MHILTVCQHTFIMTTVIQSNSQLAHSKCPRVSVYNILAAVTVFDLVKRLACSGVSSLHLHPERSNSSQSGTVPGCVGDGYISACSGTSTTVTFGTCVAPASLGTMPASVTLGPTTGVFTDRPVHCLASVIVTVLIVVTVELMNVKLLCVTINVDVAV